MSTICTKKVSSFQSLPDKNAMTHLPIFASFEAALVTTIGQSRQLSDATI